MRRKIITVLLVMLSVACGPVTGEVFAGNWMLIDV